MTTSQAISYRVIGFARPSDKKPYWVVILNERVSKAVWAQLCRSAEVLGGWSAPKWGTQPSGMGFPTKDVAEEWARSTFNS